MVSEWQNGTETLVMIIDIQEPYFKKNQFVAKFNLFIQETSQKSFWFVLLLTYTRK